MDEVVGFHLLRDGFFNQSQVFNFDEGGSVDNLLAGVVAQGGQTFDRFMDNEVANFLIHNTMRSDLVSHLR